MRSDNKHVAVFSNYFWTVYNFRKPLILELLKNGYKVTAIASYDEYAEKTKLLGCEILLIDHLDPMSEGALKETKLIWEIMRKLRKLDCKYIFTFTIKPNLFGSLTSFFTGKKIILTINGRGNFFPGERMPIFLSLMFRIAFAKAYRIIFQNNDDFNFFSTRKLLINNKRVLFVRGSGINTDFFTYSIRPPVDGEKLVFLMACRLLREKGIFEYLEAASAIKLKYPDTIFHLLGVPAINKSAITLNDLNLYLEKGIVNSLSKTDNMNLLLEEVDVLVLPSYYNEGVPKILLEGLSKGLPIITTDWVGCRETVDDGKNGFLIESKSVEAIIDAMEKMIRLSVEQRLNMRMASRKKAEKEFGEQKVLATYVAAIG